MIRLAVIATLLGLVAPASADAVTLRYADGSSAAVFQQWADASHVPTVAKVVTVHAARCFDSIEEASCTRLPGDEMWIEAPAWKLRADLTHELGHIFDYVVMTDAARRAFQRLVRDGRPWRTAPNSPHEKFASAYELCARRRTIGRYVGLGYDYSPSPAQHRRACRLIRLAAAAMP